MQICIRSKNDTAQFQDRNEMITGGVNAILLISAAVIFIGGGKSRLVPAKISIVHSTVSIIVCPPASMTVLIGVMPRIRNTEQKGTLEMLPKLSPTVFAGVVLVRLSRNCDVCEKVNFTCSSFSPMYPHKIVPPRPNSHISRVDCRAL